MKNIEDQFNYTSKSNCRVGKITSQKKIKKEVINNSIALNKEDFKLSIDEFVVERPTHNTKSI
jgi:hypothetical protein